MTKFLTSNEWQWRLARTVLQGVLGVLVANIDVLVGAAVLDLAARPIVVALGMSFLAESDDLYLSEQNRVAMCQLERIRSKRHVFS